MATKNVNFYLVKTARLSGWLLFGLISLYIVTGFALCGEYGVAEWLDVETALAIHRIFEWPLIVIFSVHSMVTIYFAMRRWGWIKKRTPTRRPERSTTVRESTPAGEPRAASS